MLTEYLKPAKDQNLLTMLAFFKLQFVIIKKITTFSDFEGHIDKEKCVRKVTYRLSVPLLIIKYL